MQRCQGFLNVDKPRGITSFEVVKRVRRFFPRQKVGHLGTLDPIAEGVLPLAVGGATRLVEFLMDVAKGYRAEMMLGGVSDTQDAWGNITVVTDELSFSLSDIEKVLELFRGEILQVPPMYSAVNYRGRRLYELARQGVEVSLEARPVTVHLLQVVQAELTQPPYRVILDVVCSKGTYIRTLCHDIGQKLGCGAYLTKLVRVFSGPFSLEYAVKLAEVEERLAAGDCSLLLPLDFPLTSMPKVVLENENDVIRLKNGNNISINAGLAAGPVLVYTLDRDLIAVGHLAETKGKGTVLKPVKVLGTQ
ncbi:MAG: tRNA pseudouridine(55) synthase TruB [Syntrophothermus sp.]|uniref:tRNA pseudouridine(55) synthase TruB n=1 Tax=Syntrophothermus sp. TaxID=2736299 RepID=UPI00258050E0|nr:tRNA pseudouridine(55) synthase TruB [Syntrophothermus sp.]NSW83656.1 tRNA pseudouridine(55) synthase TruB [Syntrophothermus sp.]